jgi:hypothetical protein
MPLHWIPTYRGFDHGSLKNDGKEIIDSKNPYNKREVNIC